MSRTPTFLCDFWYHDKLDGHVVSLENCVREKLSPRIASILLGNTLLRMAALLYLGRAYDFIVPEWHRYGRLLCLVHAVSGRKKVVILEFIDIANLHIPNLRTKIYRTITRFLLGPAIRRSAAIVQTMTEWEKARFVADYGVDPSRVKCIHWPLENPRKIEGKGQSMDGISGNYVFSSGRACCDWDTVFRAAALGQWPLVVVCSGNDLPQVEALNAGGRAFVLSDIPLSQHDQILANATVYVVSLEERMTSAGQIRLGEAISAGVPVVATAIKGLEGYLIEGVTGRSVPMEDAAALNRTITELMDSAAERQQLASRAQDYTQGATRANYFRTISTTLSALPVA